MELTNQWINNHGVNIHFIDSHSDTNQGLPFVIIPGLSESADKYIPLMKLLHPRRCVEANKVQFYQKKTEKNI